MPEQPKPPDDIQIRTRTDRVALQEIAKALPGISLNLALAAGEAKRAADALERIEARLDALAGEESP